MSSRIFSLLGFAVLRAVASRASRDVRFPGMNLSTAVLIVRSGHCVLDENYDGGS